MLGQTLSLDDLVQEGFIVAHRAALRWDSSLTRFPSYMYTRVEGGMKDRIWPFRRRKFQKDRELPISLEGFFDFRGIRVDYDDLLEDREIETYEEVETEMVFDDFCKTLKPREQYIVEELLKGRHLEAIGKDLNITESRVSQIRKKLLAKYLKATA